MAVFYFDTSALVKGYVDELGSEWVRRLLGQPSSGFHSISLVRVEMASAMARRNRLTPGAAEKVEAIGRNVEAALGSALRLVPATDEVVLTAAALARKHALRAYDAMHLAAACVLHQAFVSEGTESLTLVSADLELNAAARAEGLAVENPNEHA